MLDINDFSNIDIKVNVSRPLFLEKIQKESTETESPAIISHQAMKNIKIPLDEAGVCLT